MGAAEEAVQALVHGDLKAVATGMDFGRIDSLLERSSR
jgi:hypothetical protein